VPFSFDRRFWIAEMQRAGHAAPQPFACTMLLSRRLYPQALNHKLGTMADFHGLSFSGRAHRALADAEMAAALLECLQRDLRERFHVNDPGHELLMKLQTCKSNALLRAIERHLKNT
jgi:DNA polymerase-3 subunit epsilon